MKIIVITRPDFIENEPNLCNLLFSYGLECLHLRKPGATEERYEKFICQIAPVYRNRIVLHDHYELVQKYQLHGIHLSLDKEDEHMLYEDLSSISISCHSVEEIKNLSFTPTYCFLSPVFDSISKRGYKGHFSNLANLESFDFPVIALGGVTPRHLSKCRRVGFFGVAVLGYLWENPEEIVPRFRSLITPEVLSIAGFDPSSGAGITADLKTFEATGSYGLGVCSAITFQSEEVYQGTQWVSFDGMQNQSDVLFEKHQPEFVKIGLIESINVLDRLTEYLTKVLPDVKIVWDPILKATAGCTFHNLQEAENQRKLQNILKRLYLITPNDDELTSLFGKMQTPKDIQSICKEYQLNVLWKGGHSDGILSSDQLIEPDSIQTFSVLRSHWTKHGTGCVVSAALLSYLSQGAPLADACDKAQLYVSRFIDSNISQLGFHHSGIKRVKPSLENKPIQYITAPKRGMSFSEQVEAVCRGGMRWIQLRMKEADTDDFLQEGLLIKEICQRYNALFIINDRVDIARQLDADGVHLGKEDMNPLEARKLLGINKIIGATCNNMSDVRLCHSQGVDYIGLGPFAFTETKEKLSPILGEDGYKKIVKLMHEEGICLPVFAVGGITELDIPILLSIGVDGVAVSRLIRGSRDLSQETTETILLINNILLDLNS